MLTQEDSDLASDNGGWLDEDPGFKHNPLYQGSDSQNFAGSQDTHDFVATLWLSQRHRKSPTLTSTKCHGQ
jgi:hypothetical protein